MSIATRITSIEEHIGDIYDTLELGGADLTNTDKNLVNVKPILKQKYLDYMNNGTREIWNNWEKVPTATGENVTLNNTVQAPMDLGVGGNTSQVQYSGKNKLEPYELTQQIINGVTFTPVYENGLLQYINVNGTATENASYYIRPTNHRQTFSAGTYILNGCPTNNTIIQLFGSANILSSNFYDTGNGVTFTLNAEGNVWINLQVFSGKTANNLKVYPMIRLSSVTDGTYEPYVGGTTSPNPSFSQPITNVTGDVEVLVQNKNLALNDDPENPDANYTGSGGGTQPVQYSSTEGGYYTTNHRNRIYRNIKEGTFTISVYAKLRSEGSDNTYPIIVYAYNTETNTSYNLGSLVAKTSLTSNYQKFTRTAVIPEGYNAIRTLFYSNLYWKDIQIEYNTATTYTPHKEQTYTFPLGTQRMYLRDYLADDGIHHLRKQITFDGSESGWSSETKDNIINYKISVPTALGGDYAITCLSNYFVGVTGNASYQGTTANSIGIGSSKTLRIRKTEFETLEDFKTWLSTHNVTVEYELAEEEITPYTESQQTAYDEIKQAISYNEQTNISGSSDEANPIFTVVALKNI